MKGGDSTTKHVKVSKGNLDDIFNACREFRNELTHKTVKDEHRRTTSVMNLFQVAEMFIPGIMDNIKYTRRGYPSLKCQGIFNNRYAHEPLSLGDQGNQTFFVTQHHVH
jgi:hypothetical protein